MGHLPIRKFVWILALLGILMPTAGRAQVTINMSRVTCADYLAMAPEQSDVFGAWVGGYFNQKTGYTWIDLDAQRRNVASVRAWCATYPGQFVMTGLARATGTAAFQGDPARAVVKVDMNEITCRQFIDFFVRQTINDRRLDERLLERRKEHRNARHHPLPGQQQARQRLLQETQKGHADGHHPESGAIRATGHWAGFIRTA